MHRIYTEFRFDPDATTIRTPVRRVLTERRGVCQDFAHVQIACLRALGLSARYVSGYLLTTPPPGRPRLQGADASHAWLAVHCPHHGWVDLDPTNDLLPDQQHITLGWGRDYGDVSPLHGVILGGARHKLAVGVSVVPLDRPSGTPRSPSLRRASAHDPRTEHACGGRGTRRGRGDGSCDHRRLGSGHPFWRSHSEPLCRRHAEPEGLTGPIPPAPAASPARSLYARSRILETSRP